MMISELKGDFGQKIFILRVDQDEAESLGFDADTVNALDDENIILEILIDSSKKSAVFTLRPLTNPQDYIYEELDYNLLIEDLKNEFGVDIEAITPGDTV